MPSLFEVLLSRGSFKSFLRKASTPTKAKPRRATVVPPSGTAVPLAEVDPNTISNTEPLLVLLIAKVATVSSIPEISAIPDPDKANEPDVILATSKLSRSKEYVLDPCVNSHSVIGAVSVALSPEPLKEMD